MDRNELMDKISKSEIKREQSEILYEILKLEIAANNDSIEILEELVILSVEV